MAGARREAALETAGKQRRLSAIHPIVCGADFKTIQEASQGVAQMVKCLLH